MAGSQSTVERILISNRPHGIHTHLILSTGGSIVSISLSVFCGVDSSWDCIPFPFQIPSFTNQNSLHGSFLFFCTVSEIVLNQLRERTSSAICRSHFYGLNVLCRTKQMGKIHREREKSQNCQNTLNVTVLVVLITVSSQLLFYGNLSRMVSFVLTFSHMFLLGQCAK